MRELSFAHLPRHPSHFSASAPHAPPDFSLARWITAVSRLPFRELRLFKPTPVEKGGSPAQPLRRTVGSPAPFRLAGRGQIVKHGKLKWTRRHTRTPVILVRPVRARGPGARPSFPPSLICPRTAPGPIAKTLRLCGDPGPALHVSHHPASVWLWPRLWFRLRPRHRHRFRIQCGQTKPADFVLPPPLDPHHRYLSP